SAQLKADIGSAQKGQALGQMMPQVMGTANWSTNNQNVQYTTRDVQSNYRGTRYYVSLNQTLVDFAKYWDWRRAAKVEDQYEIESIDAQNTLILDVVDRYFSVLQAEDQLSYTRTEKQATEKQLQQVQKQFAKQLLKITDVYAVEARLDQLVADEIQAETELVTAQQTLRELTGETITALNKLRPDVDYKPLDGDLQQWLEMAQSQNPLLVSKHLAIEAAENSVAVQKSKYLPVVDLQLNFYDTDTGYQSTRTAPIQTQVAAINVNVPIFNGGTTTHQLFEAQHRLEMSKSENEATLRNLLKETSDSFLTTNASSRHIKAAVKAVDSAVKSRESMEKGLKYGVVTISDLLKAQQGEFLALRDLSKAKYTYIKNRVRFLRALGSVNEQNVLEVNAWLEGVN
ncbi:MAG: type I secretion protein TolC, partial [Methylococcaceae bacterium]|nr:type I secretion protein TolC [Methylococcaceae bacterium]